MSDEGVSDLGAPGFRVGRVEVRGGMDSTDPQSRYFVQCGSCGAFYFMDATNQGVLNHKCRKCGQRPKLTAVKDIEWVETEGEVIESQG